MKPLKQKIEAIIQGHGHPTGDPLERLLAGASRLYGRAMQVRNRWYEKDAGRVKALPCMVISVGNITVGGTGKTPMTLYLAKMLKGAGYRIAIVSRGYGGKASKAGGIVCDGKQMLLDADMAGDEPYMMAKQLGNVPVVIGSNRYEAGMTAVAQFSPDIILLDDGFQHRRLKRDLDILLLDADRPFGNGHLLPRGTLREPPAAICRAGMIVLTRAEEPDASRMAFQKRLQEYHLNAAMERIPLFTASHEPYLNDMVLPENPSEVARAHARSGLDGKSVFAFSGIAKNHDFRESAARLGCRIAGFREFSDHHDYLPSDFTDIVQGAEEGRADMLITTEKDYARIKGRFSFRLPLAVLGVSIAIREEETFQHLLRSALGEANLIR